MTRYYKRYYTGEVYSEDYSYLGPGKNTGNTTFSIGYGGDFPEEYRRELAELLSSCSGNK
jgi:hypothetical protein